MSIREELEILNEIGYEYRKIKIDYEALDHYKQIFQYLLIKKYDINQLFISYQENSESINYNTIVINDKINIEKITSFLQRYFDTVDNVVCIFIDIQSKTCERSFHTTLLIFRPNVRTLEHFDSNGMNSFGYHDIFDIIVSKLNNLTYINSVTVNDLVKYENDKDKSIRSLNFLSTMVTYKLFPGYCQLWSLFLYELIYIFKDKTTTEILKEIYSYLRGRKIKEAALISKNIIRGYYEQLVENNNEITLEILSTYNPTYIINDIELKNKIEEYMNERTIDVYVDN